MKTTNKYPARIIEAKHKFVLQLPYDVVKDENVTTFSKVREQYKQVIKQLSDYPNSYDVVLIPMILFVKSYVVKTETKLVVHPTVYKEYVPNTPKFHHWDKARTESSVVEYEDSNHAICESNQVACGLCSNPTDSVHAVQGALLRTSQRTWIDYERVNGEDIPVERKVKFPTYLKVSVCRSCMSYFTVLCNTLDSNFRRPQAKLVFNPPLKPTDKLERIEREHHTPIDAVVEYENLTDCPTETVIHAYPHSLMRDEAPNKNKAARLKPSKQTVNLKPSKKVKDYLRNHLE